MSGSPRGYDEMRHVDTSALTVPEAWLRRAAGAEVDVEAAIQDGRAPIFRPLWSDRRLRGPLIAIVGQKCWYCETDVHGSNPDVDHFRPKNGPTSPGSHSGYWWLAYKPDNYRIACKYCNSGGGEYDDGTHPAAKVALFPLLNEADRATKPTDNLKLEKPVLLDPADNYDHFLIDFSADGEPRRRSIMPLTALEKATKHCRVEESIVAYRLDRRLLVEGRLGVMKRVAGLAEILAELAGREPSVGGGLRQMLLELIDQRSQYSGAALSALRACRSFPLIEKIFAAELAADIPIAMLTEITQPAIIDITYLIEAKVIGPDTSLTGHGPTGEVTAVLLPDGRVRFGVRLYSSPDSAAKAVTGTADTDGWTFWSITHEGSPLTLAALRDKQIYSGNLRIRSTETTFTKVCRQPSPSPPTAVTAKKLESDFASTTGPRNGLREAYTGQNPLTFWQLPLHATCVTGLTVHG
jgi:hypothetical protein